MARILIVDDDPDAQELLAAFVRRQGHTPLTAGDGPAALRALKAERPHVVFLDYEMPGMDGLAVLQAIRAVDREVGVIMITGVHEEAVGRQALALGAADFLTKPIDFAYLETSLWVKLAPMLL